MVYVETKELCAFIVKSLMAVSVTDGNQVYNRWSKICQRFGKI